LDFGRFREQIADHEGYEVEDLDNLISKEGRPELGAMVDRITTRFSFLQDLTDLEQVIAADSYRQRRDEAAHLVEIVRSNLD
jgi:hypothetical protein